MKYKYEIVKFDDNIPARILMQDKPGWRCNTKPHWHKEIEFVYMLDGEMNTVTNGKKQTIKNGELFFCNSKDIHVTSVPSSQEIYKYLVVQLSYEYIKNYCMDDEVCYFTMEDKMAYASLVVQFQKLLLLVGDDKNELEKKINSIKKTQIILEIYYILLTQCKRKDVHTVRQIRTETSYARQVMEYINAHYMEELSLDKLANEVGLSAQYLSKHFKNATNMGVLQYISHVRLEHANKELLQGNETVTEVAINNGFPSVKAYIETCKKVHGMTPTQLVKEYRKR